MYYISMAKSIGGTLPVHCMEAVRISDCPLWDVLLYYYQGCTQRGFEGVQANLLFLADITREGYARTIGLELGQGWSITRGSVRLAGMLVLILYSAKQYVCSASYFQARISKYVSNVLRMCTRLKNECNPPLNPAYAPDYACSTKKGYLAPQFFKQGG